MATVVWLCFDRRVGSVVRCVHCEVRGSRPSQAHAIRSCPALVGGMMVVVVVVW